MLIIINFLPILLFVTLYVGAGVYFSCLGVDNAFYQLPPSVAILPAIALGWILHSGTTETRMNNFLDGVRHRDIITMCLIFLLAGAFSTVTHAIGSIDSAVNLSLTLIPARFLLLGIFIVAAFISTAIGTSMGTIATIAPIAANLVSQGAFPAPIAMATVVGGAMFGDSLSVVSDTTIAAVLSQEADFKAKFKINFIVASIAALLTILILLWTEHTSTALTAKPFSLILLLPYAFLLTLALSGVNVFIALTAAILLAGIIGYYHNSYSVIAFSKDIAHGFASMHDIMILSLMVAGLSGLVNKGSKELAQYLSNTIAKTGNTKLAQLFIAKIVSVFDILLANNTVAIIFSGHIAKDIAKKYNIPKHYSAAWLDIFSCVFQGIIPYGAQILLASTACGISPLAITPYVYYCYLSGLVAIMYIYFNRIQ